jgi:hypothetical protein
MITQQRTNQAIRTPIRPTSWLTVLERELKSRVGWVDEAVSPFASRRRAPALGKVRSRPIETEKAA